MQNYKDINKREASNCPRLPKYRKVPINGVSVSDIALPRLMSHY